MATYNQFVPLNTVTTISLLGLGLADDAGGGVTYSVSSFSDGTTIPFLLRAC